MICLALLVSFAIVAPARADAGQTYAAVCIVIVYGWAVYVYSSIKKCLDSWQRSREAMELRT